MHALSGTSTHQGSPVCGPLDHVRSSSAGLQRSTQCAPRAGNYRHLRNIFLNAAMSGSDLTIESVAGVRPEIDSAVDAALDRCLTDTDLGMGKKYRVSI